MGDSQMTGKSRRQRGKNSAQSKKRKGGPSRTVVSSPQPAIAREHEPAASPNVPVTSVNVPTPIAKPAAVRYPYVATELRTIGILAGIMLIILIVLALVLS